MKTFHVFLTTLILFIVHVPTVVFAADVIGLWSKTTSKDPYNITIFYREKNHLKAMGYSELQGSKIVWYGEGKIKGNSLHCSYHYSLDAIPKGWEPDGTMELTLSDDGNGLTGTARSISGNWSGEIKFKRILVVPSTLH